MAQVINYGGYKWYRSENSKSFTDRVYFKSSAAFKQTGCGLLHRFMYLTEVGPIPPGHQIHHKDGNPLNNTIDNFECISSEEHRRLHDEQLTDEERAERTERMREVQKLSAQWHRSPEGRAWHSEQMKTAFYKRKQVERSCDWCGKKWMSFCTRPLAANETSHCSSSCRAKSRRAALKDSEQRNCARCDQEFIVPIKAKPTKYCSQCSGKAKRETREQQFIEKYWPELLQPANVQ